MDDSEEKRTIVRKRRRNLSMAGQGARLCEEKHMIVRKSRRYRGKVNDSEEKEEKPECGGARSTPGGILMILSLIVRKSRRQRGKADDSEEKRTTARKSRR